MEILQIEFLILILCSLRVGPLHAQHRGHTYPEILRAAAYRDLGDPVRCNPHNMTVTIFKEQFIDMPFRLFVLDKDNRSYDAEKIASSCNYDLKQTAQLILFTTPYTGCHVRTQGGVASLTVMVRGTLDGGRIDVTERVPLSCSVQPVPIQPLVSPEQCGKDGVFTIVVFRNATVPGLVLESLRVSRGQDPACAPLLTTPESVTFRFPMVACGAQARFMDGAVVYSVNIEADKTILKGRKGSITRDRTFKLTVQCNFTLMGSTELHVKTQKQQPGEQAVLKGEGPLQLDLRLAKDAAYTSYYAPLDHPVVRVLQQPVFVEVRVLNREDPDLVLLLDNCWASTSDDPDDGLRWDLLEKGCPFSGDDYQTILQAVLAAPGVSFPNHYKRFQITMFTFVDSPSPQTFHGLVYFHCDVEVCKGVKECTVSCDKRQRRSILQDWTIHSLHTFVSKGPFMFFKD